jgi:hypothetical protein
MRSNFRGVTVLLTAALAVACKSSNSSGAAQDAGAPGSSASPSAAASSSAPTSPFSVPGATAATLPNMPFPERFAAEARSRPPGVKPTVEEVYASLGAAGFTIVDQKQHLASPLGARYCVGARAVSDTKDTLLQISVCECSTPEVARLARDYSAASMSTAIPFRTLYANRQTLLVLREEKNTPEIDALVTKASGVFAKL